MPRDSDYQDQNTKPYYVHPMDRSKGTVYAHRPPLSPDGYWSWRLVQKINGKTKITSLGRLPRTGISEAILNHIPYDDIYNEIDLSGIETVGDLLRVWYPIQKLRSLSKNTLVNLKSDCKRLVSVIGTLKLSKIQTTISQELRDFWKNKYASTTIHKTIQTLKHALQWGIDNDLHLLKIKVNTIKNPKGKPLFKNRYIPNENDLNRAIDALEGELKLSVQTVRKTGCRLGELRKAKWKNLQIKNGVHVLEVNGKCNPRDIILSEKTFELIQNNKEKRTLIDEIISMKLNSTKLRSALRKAGLPEFTFQDIRQFRANELERAGIPDLIYENQLGHSRRVAKTHYLRYPPWEIYDVLKKVDKL